MFNSITVFSNTTYNLAQPKKAKIGFKYSSNILSKLFNHLKYYLIEKILIKYKKNFRNKRKNDS